MKRGQSAVCVQYKALHGVQTQSEGHRAAELLVGHFAAWHGSPSGDARLSIPTVELPARNASGCCGGFAASHRDWAPAGASSCCAHIPVCLAGPENKDEGCP